ncbi:unnamed protein product [Sphagnum jensenii]
MILVFLTALLLVSWAAGREGGREGGKHPSAQFGVQAFNCRGQRGAGKHPSAQLGVQEFDLVIAPVAPRLALACLLFLPLC